MASTLIQRHVFGAKVNTDRALTFADDSHLLYPCGHSVVKYNIGNYSQNFINGSPNQGEITAIAGSHGKRYLAIAEAGSTPCVSLYNMRRLYRSKVLGSTPEVTNCEYSSIAFNKSDTKLVGLTSGKHQYIVLWTLDKGAVVAAHPVVYERGITLYGIQFNKLNSDILCVNGNGFLRFFTTENNNIAECPMDEEFAGRETSDYTSAAYIAENQLISGTSQGGLLYFNDQDFKLALPESPDDGQAVLDVLSFSRGFITASADGSVRIYEYADDVNIAFSQSKKLQLTSSELEGGSRILSLAVSPAEDYLALATSVNAIYKLPLGTVLSKDEGDFAELVPAHGPKEGEYLHRRGSMNSCKVHSLDSAIRKPIVVTSGSDNTIRVWNYVDKTQELCKHFADTAFSVACHPSGLHILAGFTDKLRYMNVLLDDLRPMKEINIKNCKECRFAKGGHLFAAMNVKLIQVYNSYTCEMLHSLRGHSGVITSLSFSPDDRTLLSAGLDGRLYAWNMVDGRRTGEYVAKDIKISNASATSDETTAYSVGTDKRLSLVDLNAQQVERGVPSKKALGSVVVGSGLTGILMTGESDECDTGNIISYPYPLPEGEPETISYAATSSGISKMILSHDSTQLFASGLDGSVLVYEVRDKDGRIPFREATAKMPWSDEVLVTRSDLEDMASAIAELEETQEEMQSNNEYALRMKEIAFQEDMKKLTERYSAELEQEKQQYELLQEEKMDLEREFGESISALQVSHRSEKQKREGLYQEKIMEEVERYQQKENECQKALEDHRARKQELIDAHERNMANKREFYEQQLKEARERRQEMADDKKGTLRDWEETRNQMEQDLDEQTNNMRKSYESRLEEQKQLILKCKSENGIMKKKFASLQKDIEDQQEEVQSLEENKYKLDQQISSLGKEIEVLNTMIKEKDASIGEKEKRIYELKKKNQELEKFKFVLDYKIRELKRQIEPRENEIANMKQQIKEVDAELESFHQSNAELDEAIGDIRKQIDQLHEDTSKKKIQLTKVNGIIKRFHTELYKVSHSILEPEDLRENFLKLYEEFVPKGKTLQGADQSIVEEYEKQKQYLESTVNEMQKRVNENSDAARKENFSLMQENMQLINELSSLRKQAQELETEKKNRRMRRPHPPSRGKQRPGTGESKGSELDMTVEEASKTISQQKEFIGNLRAEVKRLEEALVQQRPYEREKPQKA
eukprot:gb/GECG01003532.1/.p1 GENE.gb/GECG01003532.1/~~gb/GECG01003532.1/.p1  ORF type:complete len:1206 (+),score=233.77 gb/GECG01003532.1/:1-3618(+)